jgi:sugar phosphate isomerase/epimerase
MCASATSVLPLCLTNHYVRELLEREERASKGAIMRFGICAPFQQVITLTHPPIDYLEENVQRFLIPEQPHSQFVELLNQSRALSIPIEVANSFIPGDLPIIATPERPVDRRRLEHYVRTALERAEQANIRIIVFGSGTARACPFGYSHEDALQQIADHLTTWSHWAEEHGVQLVLEPLRYEETNTLNTVAECARFVSPLAYTGTRLLADIYHMMANREDPETLRPTAAVLTHVHVAEREKRTAPGQHGDDFRPYLSVLRAIGYDQRISIECNWGDLSDELVLAMTTLRDQWSTAF